jgi:hypothetical protein
LAASYSCRKTLTSRLGVKLFDTPAWAKRGGLSLQSSCRLRGGLRICRPRKVRICAFAVAGSEPATVEASVNEASTVTRLLKRFGAADVGSVNKQLLPRSAPITPCRGLRRSKRRVTRKTRGAIHSGALHTNLPRMEVNRRAYEARLLFSFAYPIKTSTTDLPNKSFGDSSV